MTYSVTVSEDKSPITAMRINRFVGLWHEGESASILLEARSSCVFSRFIIQIKFSHFFLVLTNFYLYLIVSFNVYGTVSSNRLIISATIY